MTKTSDRRRANKGAVGLLKTVRKMVEPQPADKMLAEAKRAQMEISKILYQLRDTPQLEAPPSELAQAMMGLKEALDEMLDGYGYCLLVFDIGENAHLSWITNSEPADVAELMSAFQEAYE